GLEEGRRAERGRSREESSTGRACAHSVPRTNPIQTVIARKITNQASDHSAIERPRNRHVTTAQSPVPVKIFGNACESGKVSMSVSRSAHADAVFGGLCCSHDWRIAVPPPPTMKTAATIA